MRVVFGCRERNKLKAAGSESGEEDTGPWDV
jgi:hypothetical protein